MKKNNFLFIVLIVFAIALVTAQIMLLFDINLNSSVDTRSTDDYNRNYTSRNNKPIVNY
ncbi:hypothetical protein ACFSSB_09085 [Lacinutrix gracilariae]|uniref:Uncharacterized protein n=1 Tax=Lacinutrix gracilariae TaxID=1747198 RepID=A0ABW5K126_9FLAO